MSEQKTAPNAESESLYDVRVRLETLIKENSYWGIIERGYIMFAFDQAALGTPLPFTTKDSTPAVPVDEARVREWYDERMRAHREVNSPAEFEMLLDFAKYLSEEKS